MYRIINVILVIFIGHIGFAQTWNVLNDNFFACYNNKEYDKALFFAEKALLEAQKEFGKSHENYGLSLRILGRINQELCNNEKALTLYLDALTNAEKSFGIEHAEYGKNLIDIANVHRSLSDLNNALPLYEKAIGIIVATLGKDHPYYEIVINNLADVYYKMEKFENALTLYIESLEITEKSLGKGHSYFVSLLSKVGLLYSKIGQYEKALPYYLESLEIIEKNVDMNPHSYGIILSDLGGLYSSMGNYEKALFFGSKALETGEKYYGKSHSEYATMLNNLGVVYLKKGEYDKALILSLNALEIIRKNLSNSYPNNKDILVNIGSAYKYKGEYEKALPIFLEVLENTKNNLGELHPDYGSDLSNLGILYSDIGQYDKALPLYLKGLKNIELRLGKSHPKYGIRLNNLSLLYSEMGQYEKALPHALEALRNIKMNLGQKHPEYGTILNNISTLYQKIGQTEKAISINLEALDFAENNLDKSHPLYGTVLNNLGNMYSELGRFDDAIINISKALAVIEKNLGKSHPLYGTVLNNRAYLYSVNGQYEKALFIGFEAKEIIEKNLGKIHPSYGMILFNLGLYYSGQKQYEKAIPYFLEAVENGKINLGTSHPEYGRRLVNLGIYYSLINKNEDALLFTKQGCKILLDHFILNSKFLSEEDNENFHNLIRYYLSVYKGMVLASNNKNSTETGDIYDFELQLKNLILRSSIDMRQTFLVKSDSFIVKIYEEWITLRSILAKQNSNPNIKIAKNVDEIQEKCNNLESELARESAQFREDLKSVKWTDIQQSLDSSMIAIEFIDVECFSKGKATDGVITIAMVIKRGNPYPQFVPLFMKKQLDSLIERKITKESSFINKIYSDQKIYDLIWKPIESFLQKRDRIYFAPSGILNQLSLGAITTPESTYLSDEYTFNQVTTTAILASGQDEEKSVPDIAIFGGIDFDASDEQIATTAKDILLGDDIVSRSLYTQDSTRSGKWTYLNGTLDEAQSIDKMAKSKNIQSQLFTGSEAVEERFKSLSGKKSPSVIHIATHGFFFPDPKIDKKKLEMMPFQHDNTFTLADNPMNRSGLLLAGGNKAWIGEKLTTDREDGILTAYEVSNMSLFNTELVVLSACETGLGDIKDNEGVYGLQRAFKQAGVRYLMMSLWKVPDLATKEFMTTFYTEYITHQKPVREAFNVTQSKMKDKYRNEPYKWGGFVLME